MFDSIDMIALVALALVVVAYIAYKVKEKNIQQDKKLREIEIDKLEESQIKTDEIQQDDFDEVQEDDFDEVVQETESAKVQEKVQEKVQKQETNQHITIPTRDTVEVPPHDKITKDDFKEFKDAKILVAEDNLINQKVIKGLLEDSGMKIVIANDGQEALDILSQDSDFDFVLMDAHMPRLDGFGATKQIRQNQKYQHIIVVALSGDTASDDIRKMGEAGMEEFLEKPLKPDALYDILYKYLKAKKDTTPKETSSDFIALDTKRGLEVCGGDEGFYHEILNEFLENYKNSAEKLKDMTEQTPQEASKLLLDIIGVSANIGATSLNATAISLRNAIKEQSKDTYNTLLQQYKDNFDAVSKEIKTIID